ncbi:unnamed protein product, partial [marine sediment metagenome]
MLKSFPKKKVLIFTDSRGQHKNTFKTKFIFPEKIKYVLNCHEIETDLMCCPFKWTTTLDFIECINRGFIDVQAYDVIILYTGIVEHSPRPKSNAINSVYNNPKNDMYDYHKLKGIYSKIINNKKETIDNLFNADAVLNHLSGNLDCLYENEQTINLLSFEMLENVIIPYLKTIDNLIYINSNRIVPGWKGNYYRR